jgi:hypothetical protein
VSFARITAAFARTGLRTDCVRDMVIAAAMHGFNALSRLAQ